MTDPASVTAGSVSPTLIEHGATAPEIGTSGVPSPGAPEAAREKPRSLGRDAWEQLRRNPVVIVATILIGVLLVMAAFPRLFSSADPRYCDLLKSAAKPSKDAWFGNDIQGCDVYARTVYGARASIVVGMLATVFTVILGGLTGMIAGYYGGKLDAVLSRLTDIFFAIPLLLGAIIVLTTIPSGGADSEWIPIFKVAFALAILGWPSSMRIMRSSIIQVKSADYVQASRAMGATGGRILRTHALPNAIQPVIVVATITLGVYIAAEATLSFLGVGLQAPAVSWGIAISDGQIYMRTAPHMLIFPSLFLSVTVLAFIMLGDAVRDALDPKLR